MVVAVDDFETAVEAAKRAWFEGLLGARRQAVTASSGVSQKRKEKMGQEEEEKRWWRWW